MRGKNVRTEVLIQIQIVQTGRVLIESLEWVGQGLCLNILV